MMKRMAMFVFMIVVPFALHAAEGPKQLTTDQAKLLARTAAEAEGLTKLRGFSLEPGQMDQFPDFYFFDALIAEVGAQGFSGHYAVDKFTGEVWDPYKCSRISSGRLSKLQHKIRRELGLTTGEYRRHSKNKPCLA